MVLVQLIAMTCWKFLMLGLLGTTTLLGYGGFLARFDVLLYSRVAKVLCLSLHCSFLFLSVVFHYCIVYTEVWIINVQSMSRGRCWVRVVGLGGENDTTFCSRH